MQVDSQYLKTTKTKKMKTKSSFRLTLHCGDDEPVTPGALLSISLKKQGQVVDGDGDGDGDGVNVHFLLAISMGR